MKERNKKTIILISSFLFFIFLSLACATTSTLSSTSTPRDRLLTLDGYTISESDFGGVERWYLVDKFGDDTTTIRFQVGYFKGNNTGFILYEDGTVGNLAYFSREGLDLRWDWGENGNHYRYSFVIQPDGTGLYYDFLMSTDGTAKARGVYQAKKF